MSTRWKYSLDVNSWNTRFLKVQLARNFDQERENCSQILVCMMCHEEIIVFTDDKCKFKGFTVKLWKKPLLSHISHFCNYVPRKGVFAKNERAYRLNAIKKRFWSLIIWLLSVASIRRKLLKTSHTEECSARTNWGSWNIRLGL